MSRIIQPQPWLSQIPKGTPALVSCVSVLFASGPLARPCLDIFKQVSKQAYILQARAHLDKHIKHINHIQALINGLRHEGGRCGHRTHVFICAYCLR